MRSSLTTIGLLAALLAGSSAPRAATWYILPDGSGDAPTIEAGLDSAGCGDTVLVACGTYIESNSLLLDCDGMVLRSESVDPGCVVIQRDEPGNILAARGDVQYPINGVVFEGLTIQGVSNRGLDGYWANGEVRNCRFLDNTNHAAALEESDIDFIDCEFTGNSAGQGGAVFGTYSSPDFNNCEFQSNTATTSGGAVYLYNGFPWFRDCSFVGNSAPEGGAYRSVQTLAIMKRCTFAGNSADYGGAIYRSDRTPGMYLDSCTVSGNSAVEAGGAIYLKNAAAILRSSIVSFSTSGEAVACDTAGGAVLAQCTDVYGNAGGDWVDCLAGQDGTDGNFSANPKYCDAANGDFDLKPSSPCIDAPGCGRIGAHDGECTSIPVGVAGAGPAGDALRPPLTVYPNPARGGIDIRFSLAGENGAAVRIYDVTGRLVRTVGAESAAGLLRWDGRDEAGHRSPPGVYFVRIDDGRNAAVRKVMLLR